jgi:hypothetical protein
MIIADDTQGVSVATTCINSSWINLSNIGAGLSNTMTITGILNPTSVISVAVAFQTLTFHPDYYTSFLHNFTVKRL